MTTGSEQRTSNDIDNDVDSFIAKRQLSMGSHFKFDQSRSLGIAIAVTNPNINTSDMSATAIISTPTVDRAGDLLIPKGCLTNVYQKNPVVLWTHGLTGVDVPIGTAAKNGKLSIAVSDSQVEATTWFAQSFPFAVQIFDLICEGVIRAVSVRETPQSAKVVYRDGEKIVVVDLWELEEISWCAMGVNPDAVAKAIHKNRSDGRQLDHSIMKSLLAVAPALKGLWTGFESKRKSMDGDNPNSGADGKKKVDAKKIPYGKQVLDATHGDMKRLVQNMLDCCGDHLEQPAIRDGLKSIADGMCEHLKAMEGLHGEHYAAHESTLKSDDIGGGVGEADNGNGDAMVEDETAMKSAVGLAAITGRSQSVMKSLDTLLSRNKTSQLAVDGMAFSLKSMITADNLTSAQRSTLLDVVQTFDKMATRAKSRMVQDEENRRKSQQTSSQKSVDDTENSKAIEDLDAALKNAKALLAG